MIDSREVVLPPSAITVTIPAGQSLSDAFDLSGANGVFLVLPADWTPARITFQFAADSINFFDLLRADGTEPTITVTGRLNTVSPFTIDGQIPKGKLKLRSGTRASPIPQQADRIFQITII